MIHRTERLGRAAAALVVLLVSMTVTAAAIGSPGDRAARVVILANRNEPESMRLAHYYAERRGIPKRNIAAFPMARDEVVDWHQFVGEVFTPLQDWLLDHGWLDATRMALRDGVGRRKLAIIDHRVEFLVVCRGVPLKIRETSDVARDSPAWAPNAFRIHRAAVDSELALLAQSGTRIDGVVANPLFGRESPSAAERARVVRVSRLDGPSLAAAQHLVDSALAAERHGLAGRAYVDRGGPHPRGDRWLDAVAQQLDRLGFVATIQREPATLAITDAADGAALYFGWYDERISGPFSLPGYRFAPGAIALHIHSFSAPTLRSENAGGWCGPLVARGVAATFGNVDEPYLEYTHQPQLLLRALARGMTLGEAAFYAVPVLSWQPIVIGDPLYRPFLVSADEQWGRRDELPVALAPYVVLRRAHALEREGHPAEALALLRDAEQAAPSLPLAIEIVRREAAVGEPLSLERLRRIIVGAGRLPPETWGFWSEAARHLRGLGAGTVALEVWQAVLAQALPPSVRGPWLREAHALALEAGEQTLGRRWDDELAALELSP